MAPTGAKRIWYLLRLVGRDTDVNLRATEKLEFDAWRWNEGSLSTWIGFKRNVYQQTPNDQCDTLTPTDGTTCVDGTENWQRSDSHRHSKDDQPAWKEKPWLPKGWSSTASNPGGVSPTRIVFAQPVSADSPAGCDRPEAHSGGDDRSGNAHRCSQSRP